MTIKHYNPSHTSQYIEERIPLFRKLFESQFPNPTFFAAETSHFKIDKKTVIYFIERFKKRKSVMFCG